MNQAAKKSNVGNLLNERRLLLEKLAQLDSAVQQRLEQSAIGQYQPLTSANLSTVMAENVGTLKVRELLLLAGISATAYYNAMSKVDSVQVGTLKALLDAVGLELFIGKKLPDISLPSDNLPSDSQP